MGCGKSTIGRKLARRLDYGFADTDDLIVRAHGPIPAIFTCEGEAAFRDYERAAVAEALANETNTVIALGGGALTIAANRRLLQRHARRIFIKATPEQILSRLRRSRELRPLLGAEPTLDRITSLYQRRMPQYLEADLVVETQGMRSREVIETVTAWLRQHDGQGGES